MGADRPGAGPQGRGVVAAPADPVAGDPTGEFPVARVLPLLAVSHLDREFDYRVPDDLSDAAQPGALVRVRFSGRLVDAYLLQRRATSDHPGKLGKLERVVSAVPLLTPAISGLATEIADRYAGTRADVLRLAVPPRHARAEKAALDALAGTGPPAVAMPTEPGDPDAWDRYTAAASFLAAVRGGRAPRAVWQALPGEDWPARLADLTAVAATANGRSLLIVPDQADVDRVVAAVNARFPASAVAALSAGLGPQARFRRWLAARLGTATVIVGTRSAVFAPIADLRLIAVWDDGDESLAEPRAPYPHAREVAAVRAHREQAALVIGGFGRTAEAQALVDAGWAHDLLAPRSVVREHAPRIVAAADSEAALARDPLARTARLPAVAFDAARKALAADLPVLVQVPRRGYAPALACTRCRTSARCRVCNGPLAQGARGSLACRWCGVDEPAYRCAVCGGTTVRATIIGMSRTAEEFGRAFAGATVVTSGGDHIVRTTTGGAKVVVATPGAEPIAAGGYGAALLLDPWIMLGRADLRAGEETVRRWFAAAALVRSDGLVVCVADPGIPAVQALIRWDPQGFAATEVVQRVDAGFPPAVHMASVEGAPEDAAALVEAAQLPPAANVLGPVIVPRPDGESLHRFLVRVPRGDGRILAEALHAAQVGRSLRREGGPTRIQMDPLRIG